MENANKEHSEKKENMETLYHYCSNKAFHSIIKSRSIWLSSLSLSNDSMEGKLVLDIITEIAKNDSLDENSINRLQNSVSLLNKVADGLGFCLSEEMDLLSQWRAYTDDASGVSIGFSKKYLEKLSDHRRRDPEKWGFTLQKVVYEKNKQIDLIKPTYEEIKELINKGAYKISGRRSLLDTRTEEEIEKDDKEFKKAYSNLSIKALCLLSKLYLLKQKAFREEQEWRLISYLVKSGDDDCSFRVSRNIITPYRKFPLLDLDEPSVVRVVLGPKNETPEDVIANFLRQNNFNDVKIVRSEASYR